MWRAWGNCCLKIDFPLCLIVDFQRRSPKLQLTTFQPSSKQWAFTVLLRVKAEIDQIAEGLELFNVLRLIRKYPTEIREMFICDPHCKPTLDEMTMLFQPKYSNDQSSRKVIEEASVMYWNEFLQDVSHGVISMLTIWIVLRCICLFNLLVVEGSYTFNFQSWKYEALT